MVLLSTNVFVRFVQSICSWLSWSLFLLCFMCLIPNYTDGVRLAEGSNNLLLLNVRLHVATQTATQSLGWLRGGAVCHSLDNGSYLVRNKRGALSHVYTPPREIRHLLTKTRLRLTWNNSPIRQTQNCTQ